MNNLAHRWGLMDTTFGTFAAWVDERDRLVRLFLRAADAAAVDPSARRDDRAIKHVARQIAEYCAGKRQAFDLECAPRGTPFQCAVWNALLEIPFGETTSYGALAVRLGRPGAARAVGLANGSNPIAVIVPCHRVIGAHGSLTGYGGGLPLKRALLAFEAAVAGRPRDRFAPIRNRA